VLAGTKAKAWEHEREWRLVLINCVGPVRIPPEMIDGVILGLRTDKKCEEEIRQWIKERKAPTKLFRVTNEEDSFLFKIAPI
jgi:hypothetical protein